MSGIVKEVGENVYEFRKGDRIAGAHPMQTSNGTYAEYATAPVNTFFLLPPNISFEEACTIPFALGTAALGLYQLLKIPFPTSPDSSLVQPPLIIYGGASAIGSYTLKLAKLGRFEKIITGCGSGRSYLESLGVVTDFIDYREENVVSDLKATLGDKKCFHAVDAINNGTSWKHLSEVLECGGRISVYLPRLDYSSIPPTIFVGVTFFGTVHGQPTPFWDHKCEEDVDFAYSLFRLAGRWLARGKMSGHPYEILPHGLESVEDGLRQLKEGNITARKLIYRVADTPGIEFVE